MPGFILHLTAAKMFLDMLPEKTELFMTPEERNAFMVGNLVPDAVKEKSASHFRNPDYRNRMIEYPEFDVFLQKYKPLLGNASCLGYYFHLYVDRRFFREYIPMVAVFLDKDGDVTDKRQDVVQVYIRKSGTVIPLEEYLSEEYYYGDYTRMNTWLVERYHLPMDLDGNVKNPGIEEVDYRNIDGVLEALQGYMQVPTSEAENVRVFDKEDLLDFLQKITEEFVKSEMLS